jgi:ELP3 family radical SAM enzyme/protein acetyltransferase
MVWLQDIIMQIQDTDPELLDKKYFLHMKRRYAKNHKLAEVPSNSELLRVYHDMLKNKQIQPSLVIEWLLKKRAIRSQSGIVPVQVLTKPYWCPGKCIFCPNDFTMPKSYINTEPGAMRALLNNFDPIKQVYNRLLSLTLTGHAVDKIEMIVLGGTWDVYPDDYKEEFIKWLYDACNTFQDFYEKVQFDPDKKYSYTIQWVEDIQYPATIQESQQINESAGCRMIGLTVETRPEYVNDENCQFWRKLGVTRLEMGVQSLYDDVLDANKRWHTVEQARQAVHKLRQYGYKMSLHMMPWLYGSDYDKDIDSFRQLYDDPYFRPDEIKFYPTSVIPNTELYELYLKWEYKPLETDVIQQLIREVLLDIIPPYTRIKRLIRDIPSTEIVAGSSVTNLSQLTHDKMKKELKDTPVMQWLYKRLYKNACIFDSLGAFLAESYKLQAEGIQTFVIGQEPDIQQYRNFVSLDTRSREIRNRFQEQWWLPQVGRESGVVNLLIRRYHSSMWWEYFLSFEDELGYLYGLLRLLLPERDKTIDFVWLGADTAMVRELHVYGQLAQLKATGTFDKLGSSLSSEKPNDENSVALRNRLTRSIEKKKEDSHYSSPLWLASSPGIEQHKGFGSQLVAAAEQIARHYNYGNLSIIAGVWVKAYYRKLGYEDVGTYVVKQL